MEERAPPGYARLIMSADTDPTRSAADAAAAPLDLLLADAATGMMRRINPGGSGLRLAAALTARPRLVAGRGTQLAGQPAAAPCDAGVPGRRGDRRGRGGRGRAGRERCRTGRVRADQYDRRAGPEQQPAAEPGRGEGCR